MFEEAVFEFSLRFDLKIQSSKFPSKKEITTKHEVKYNRGFKVWSFELYGPIHTKWNRERKRKRSKKIKEQGCLPVGCVPSAPVAVCPRGGVCREGVCLGGVHLPCGQNGRRLWKHNLSATTVAGGKKALFTCNFSARFCQWHLWSFLHFVTSCEQHHRNDSLNPF